MKHSFFAALVCAFALTLAGCNSSNNGPEVNMKHIAGIWGYAPDQGYVPQYNFYIEVLEDGSFRELFPYAGDNYITYYACYTGQVTLKNNQLTFWSRTYRNYFYYKDIMRIANIDEQTSSSDMELSTISDTKLSLANGYAFYRLDQYPDEWKQEFFEEEKAVSQSALIGTWNLRNYFVQKDGQFTWWSYDDPANQGIRFMAGDLLEGRFIPNAVWEMLHEQGKVAEDEYINITYSHCSWTLEDNIVVITCNDYRTYDPETQTYSDFIPFEPALKIELEVLSLTDSFLVLYSAHWDRHYVFASSVTTITAPRKADNCQPTSSL